MCLQYQKEVTIISNILLLPDISVFLNDYLIEKRYRFHLSYVPYSEYENRLFAEIENADIVVVWLNFEALQANAPIDIKSGRKTTKEYREHLRNIVSMLYEHIRKLSSALVIWIGMEDYGYKFTESLGNISFMEALIDHTNLYVMEMLQLTDVYVDLKKIIANIGCGAAYNNTWKYRWNAPYSKQLIQKVAEEICRQYWTYIHDTKKCIILDCDNVLWGGILSEIGVEGIQLGNEYGGVYQDFQRYILYLYYCGIILCICSKNNEDEVKAIFRESSSMILKEEHIACFQVGWESKVKGIRRIAQEINIGFDSMIFVDDSEHEINEIRAFLPEVECVLFNKKTIYTDIKLYLTNFENIDEIRKRHMTYITNNFRKELKRKYILQEDYLNALDNRISIEETKKADIKRISELLFRSNTCTIGMRYRVDEIEKMLSDTEKKLYTVCVSDRFSDLGLVGAIGISNNVLIFFVLSCRALGRGVEETMIEHVIKMGVLEVSFVFTKRNQRLFTLFSDKMFLFKNLS